MVITIVNYLVILQASDALDLAKDYTALMVIANFDDIYYAASKLTLLKNILEVHADDYVELFQIETTSSLDARGNQNVKLKKDEIYDLVVENVEKQNEEWIEEKLKEIRDEEEPILDRMVANLGYFLHQKA